jgi:EAL domain-containing protein (putative c-di-GMP-specific phosphodiesterase class I)
VIAEGVETEAHGTLLLQLGCEVAQGYGIAKPMPGDTFPPWLQQWRPNPDWLIAPMRG